MTREQKPVLFFVVGSTATGKTEFSLIAKSILEAQLNGPCEIVNCDSIQVFQGIDIGTAKPSLEQRKKATHHLLDFVGKGETYTAGEYRRDALKILSERSKVGVKSFVVVGGSGFYAQALEKGMFELEPVSADIREKLDLELKERGLEELYQELQDKDPDYAQTIAAKDTYRILRALEILRSQILKPQPKTLTQIRSEFANRPSELLENYKVSKIGIRTSREILRERITKRTNAMLEAGWIDEVKTLRAEGLGSWAPMLSVGYKEIQNFLDAQLPESELRESIITSTMQLAKRQMTWFKRDEQVHWCESEENWLEAKDVLKKLVAEISQ